MEIIGQLRATGSPKSLQKVGVQGGEAALHPYYTIEFASEWRDKEYKPSFKGLVGVRRNINFLKIGDDITRRQNAEFSP